jgi:hypothetical protein
MPEFLKYREGFFNLNLVRSAVSELDRCTIVFASGDEYVIPWRGTDWIEKLLELREDAPHDGYPPAISLPVHLPDVQFIEKISDTKCFAFYRKNDPVELDEGVPALLEELERLSTVDPNGVYMCRDARRATSA